MTSKESVKIEYIPVSELHPDAANPRRITDEQLESLTRSIREFGLVDPVIARQEDNTVIADISVWLRHEGWV